MPEPDIIHAIGSGFDILRHFRSEPVSPGKIRIKSSEATNEQSREGSDNSESWQETPERANIPGTEPTTSRSAPAETRPTEPSGPRSSKRPHEQQPT